MRKSVQKKLSQATVTSGSVHFADDAPKASVATVRINKVNVDSDYDRSLLDEELDISDVEIEDEIYSNEEEEYIATGKNVRVCQPCLLDVSFFDIKTPSLTDTSEDTIEVIGDFVPDQVESQDDFFEKLGEWPDIEEISSPHEASGRKTMSVSSSISLYGQFVDPLTGRMVSQSENETTILEEVEEEEGVEAFFFENNDAPVYEEFVFEDFDSRFPVITEKVATAVEDESLTLFFAAQESPSQKTLEEPKPHTTIGIGAVEETEKFLHDLINYVIRFSEYEQSAEVIRKRLNKSAMFEEIKKTVFDIDVERKVNMFLNRKCVEYFRRKGFIRYIQEETPEKMLQEMANYKEKSEYLNKILGEELAVHRKTQKKMSELTIKADEEEENRRLEIAEFENLVRKTIKCHLNSAFEKFVNHQLKHMACLREEISSTRSIIILRQHALGALRARLHELENIGNGLHLADYENLQRDMLALDKKIEDRNRELGKMHGRFNHNLHSMAHIKLKSEVTIDSIHKKFYRLKKLEDDAYLSRQRLFYLNVTHKSTRRQLKELSIRSGLLDKPALLHDYDATMERVRRQRNKVQELRKTLNELEQKMQKLGQTDSSLTKTNANNAKKPKNLKYKSANEPIFGLEGICLNI